jgi:O-antigen/teichoic acid export membrane protein
MNEFWAKIKDISAVGAADITSTGLSGIFWFYMASLIGPSGYGEIVFFLTVAGAASNISLFGFTNSLMVLGSKGIKIQSTLYFIAIVGGTISSIVVFMIFYQLGVSILVLGLLVFGLVTFDVLGKKLFKNYAKIVISQKILLISLCLIFYYLIGNEGIILGMALANFPYLYSIISTFRSQKLNFSLLKEHSSFLRNNFFLTLTGTLSFSLDKIIIGPLFGFAMLGNYALGMQVLVLLLILPKAVGKYIIPHDAAGNHNKKIKIIVFLFSFLLTGFGTMILPIIISNFFVEFTEAVTVIQILSFITISSAINMIYTSKFLGIEKSNIVFRGTVIAVSTQIIGIIVLGSLFEINGIALSAVIGSFAVSIFYIITVRLNKF